MNRQQNVLNKNMSLHEIKDKMQLTFAKEQADFIINNLEKLIDNTNCVAPVRKKKYTLGRPDDRNLTHGADFLEKHWEEAIFRKWEKVEDGLDPQVPFRKIVSYQVMLRDTNKNSGWGELDLLGATAGKIPVAIELKINPSEYLLRAIVEVLAYGVAIQKAWNKDGCPLRTQWAKVVGEVDSSLVDLPLVVMAPAKYWQVVFSDSPKRRRFQTPQPVCQSIKKLLAKMDHAHYPLTFVEVPETTQSSNSEFPDIFNAVIKDMPIPNGSSK